MSLSAVTLQFGSLVVCLLIYTCQGEIDIGKYLVTCDRNSPDVNDCLVDAVQDGLAAMTDGIPDLGIPPVDPYLQKELKVEHKRNLIWAKMKMNNILVHGLKGSTVKNARLKADDDKFNLEIDMFTPRVHITGNYNGEGRYNAFHILADGDFNTTMKNLVYTWKLNGKPEVKDNQTYVRIISFGMAPDVGDMKSYITNNNPDSKPLTELGNNFANDNWRVLYRELLPYAEANWNKIGSKIVNKLFLKVPYNQLFPNKL